MSLTEDTLKELFDKIYVYYFGDKGSIPNISFKYLIRNIDRFTQGIVNSSLKSFHKENRWNLVYFFMGELYSDFFELYKQKNEFIKYDKKSNIIKILDDKSFFVIIMILRNLIYNKKVVLEKNGFQKWFVQGDHGGFLKELRGILEKPDLRMKIMHGRPIVGEFFKDSKEIIQYLKGSLSNKKIQEILDICRVRSPGSWKKRKGFRNVQELKQTSLILFNHIKSSLKYSGEGLTCGGEHVSKRITQRKCLKYLLYLGLMGTIQTRVCDAVSLSSKLESDFFTYYIQLRKACIDLGWLQLVDNTFCPGIRCKTFLIKVMCYPVKITEDCILMNKIEMEYLSLEPLDSTDAKKVAFFARYGNVKEYLTEKIVLYLKFLNAKKLKKDKRSISYSILMFGKENGNKWTNQQRMHLYDIHDKIGNVYQLKKNFEIRYSKRETFDWNQIRSAA